MINAVTTAQRLDWDGWLLGIMGAAISGGAGAVASGVGGTLIAPNEFNLLQGKAGHLFALMGIVFAISAIFSLCKYLQQHPVPDRLQAALQAAATSAQETKAAITQAQQSAPEAKS